MKRHELLEERLSHSVIGAFYEVYNTLGFGFLEHIYVMALERELLARGHEVGREVSVPIMYKGELLGNQRLDMIVDRKLVVETKSRMTFTKPPHGRFSTTSTPRALKLASSSTSVPNQNSIV